MKCPECGNTDINEILIWFFFAAGGEQLTADTAPAAIFLSEWKARPHPVTIDKATCLTCALAGRGEVAIPFA